MKKNRNDINQQAFFDFLNKRVRGLDNVCFNDEYIFGIPNDYIGNIKIIVMDDNLAYIAIYSPEEHKIKNIYFRNSQNDYEFTETLQQETIDKLINIITAYFKTKTTTTWYEDQINAITIK